MSFKPHLPRPFRSLVVLLLLTLLPGCNDSPVERTTGPLAHGAYVWNSEWKDEIPEAIRSATAHCPQLREIVVLGAEISIQKGVPETIHPPLNAQALQALALTSQECALVLRVGPFGGTFRSGDLRTQYLRGVALSLVKEAQKSGCLVTELQIDFDCPESKLSDYCVWVAAIREALQSLPSPVSVSVSILPHWLENSDLGSLVREAGTFILQAHVQKLPKPGEKPTLCDPLQVQHWVERAARYRVPFQVSLPTFTNQLAFDSTGNLIGFSSDGADHEPWTAETRIITTRANPQEMAELVQTWTRNRPTHLTGILWYRLPLASDQMNWRLQTFATVLAGRVPKSSLRFQATPADNTPSQITLLNEGEQDEPLPAQVRAIWTDARLISANAAEGYTAASTPNTLRFSRQSGEALLHPGEQRLLGTVTLDPPAEIHVNAE